MTLTVYIQGPACMKFMSMDKAIKKTKRTNMAMEIDQFVPAMIVIRRHNKCYNFSSLDILEFTSCFAPSLDFFLYNQRRI